MKDEPRWILMEEKKEHIKKTILPKFTPEQQKELERYAKEMEKELE